MAVAVEYIGIHGVLNESGLGLAACLLFRIVGVRPMPDLVVGAEYKFFSTMLNFVSKIGGRMINLECSDASGADFNTVSSSINNRARIINCFSTTVTAIIK